MDKKEIITILLATLVLALTVSYRQNEIFYASLLSFLIIISINVITKKLVGFHFETSVITKLWSIKQYGFRKDFHFKSQIPMVWLPLLITLFTKGFFLWLGVLEFDIKAKAERVAKRHGLYRFTQVTEWHMGLIAIWAIVANLIFAIIGYIAGFELFAKLSIYYIAWSIIPIGRLDGSKILFASKGMWITALVLIALILGWGLVI